MQLDQAPQGIFSVTSRYPKKQVQAAAERVAANLSFEEYKRLRVQRGVPTWKNPTCQLLEELGRYLPICTARVTIPHLVQSCPITYFREQEKTFSWFR